jgi:hypothetical protein
MNSEAIISELEKAWDFDNGFFGILRQGRFDTTALQRVVCVLDAISLRDEVLINRRVVSLLWYMPLFMGWQRECVQESGGNVEDFDKASNLVQTSIERLLGVP